MRRRTSGSFPPEQYAQPSRSDRRRHESRPAPAPPPPAGGPADRPAGARRRWRRRALRRPDAARRFGTTPDFAGQGSGDGADPGRSPATPRPTSPPPWSRPGVVKSEKAFRNAAKDDPRSVVHPAGDLQAAQGDERRLRAHADPRPDRPGAGPGDGAGGAHRRGHPEADRGQDPAAAQGPAGGGEGHQGARPARATRRAGWRASSSRRRTTWSRHHRGRACCSRWSRCTRSEVDTSGLSARAADVDLDPYKLLIVASLVERETQRVEERPKVARVIYNRLRAGLLPRRGRRDPVRAGPVRRRAVGQADLEKRHAVQQPPAQGPAADPDRQPRGGVGARARWSRRRGTGSTTSWTPTGAGGTSSPTTPTVFNAAKAKCRAAGLC